MGRSAGLRSARLLRIDLAPADADAPAGDDGDGAIVGLRKRVEDRQLRSVGFNRRRPQFPLRCPARRDNGRATATGRYRSPLRHSPHVPLPTARAARGALAAPRVARSRPDPRGSGRRSPERPPERLRPTTSCPLKRAHLVMSWRVEWLQELWLRMAVGICAKGHGEGRPASRRTALQGCTLLAPRRPL